MWRRSPSTKDRDATLPDSHWVKSLPLARIPAAIAQLAALQSALASRLLLEHDSDPHASGLIDAPTLALRLGVKTSHVRTLAREGRIPFKPVGRYVRFDPAAVAAALAESK